jgi:hypothetical protein
MKKLLIPAFLLFLAAAVWAQDGKTVTVTVRGEATLFGGDIPAAREEALVDAQRNALEQVLGVQIKAQTAVQDFMLADDTILSMVSGYVKSSKILSEKTEKEFLVIEAQVEVSKEITPEAAGKLLRNFSCVVGFFSETDGKEVYDDRLTNQLVAKLVKGGFDVRDASQLFALSGFEDRVIAAAIKQDMTAARNIGWQALSNIVIVGYAKLTAGEKKEVTGFAGPVAVYTYNCWIDLRAIETSTGKIIAQYAPDMGGVTGTGSTPEKASQDALTKAGDKAFGAELFDQLAEYGKEKGIEVRVEVENIPTLEEYNLVKQMLNNIRFRDSDVRDEGFEAGKTSVFSFKYAENIRLIALKLDHTPKLSVIETTKDKVVARYNRDDL